MQDFDFDLINQKLLENQTVEVERIDNNSNLSRRGRLQRAFVNASISDTHIPIRVEAISDRYIPIRVEAINVPSSHGHSYKISKRENDCSAECLCQKDWRCSPNGIILTEPGYYVLCSDIDYTPTIPGTSAITIAASGIVVDLASYTLRQTNMMGNTYGIAVARDVSNFKITAHEQRGRIIDFTLAGIRVFGRTESYVIENIITTQNTRRSLRNIDIPVNCLDILTLTFPVGIIIGEGDTGYIAFAKTDRRNTSNKFIIRNVVTEKTVIGLHIVFATRFVLEDNLYTECSYYGKLIGPSWLVTETSDPRSPVVFPVASDYIVRNCRADANEGPFEELSNPGETFNFDFLSGMGYYETQNGRIYNSSSSNNKSITTLLAANHDGSRGMYWENCTITNNLSTNSVCDGFHFSGSIPFTIRRCLGVSIPLQRNYNNHIKNIISTGNRGKTQATNFTFAYCEFLNVDNCVSQGAQSNGGIAYGFYIVGSGGIQGGDNNNIILKNCITQGNGNVTAIGGAGIAIDTPSASIVIENTVINGNGISSGTNSIAAGIFIRARRGALVVDLTTLGVDKVIMRNNTITNNGSLRATLSGGIVVLRNELARRPDLAIKNLNIIDSVIAYNIGDGIRIDGNITGVVIKNNQLDQNTGVGVNIVNNTNPIFVAKNIAYGNTLGNYSNNLASTVIEGTTTSLPDTVGLKNVSIRSA